MLKDVSESRLDKLIIVSLTFLTLIVFTGAAVRLTQSGLGCEDWPGCTQDRIVPEWEFHELIEFGNRLLSALVGVAALVAAIGAQRRNPKLALVSKLGWVVVAGVIAQGAIGAVTVIFDLHPVLVGLHFLASMLLLTAAIYMWKLNRSPGSESGMTLEGESGTTLNSRPEVTSNNRPEATSDDSKTTVRNFAELQQPSKVLLGFGALALFFGTIVTGTGPNSGDARADRLQFELEDVTRIHSLSVWVLLAAIVFYYYKYKADNKLRRPFVYLAILSLIQGGIGYLQYNLGLPSGIVLLHVIGATFTWIVLSYVYAISHIDTNS